MHDKHVSAPSAPSPWPGVSPVKAKAVTKLGTLEQAPVSLPKRALNFIRHQVQQLRGHGAPELKVGLPVMPAHANVGAQVIKALSTSLGKLDAARSEGRPGTDDVDDAPELRSAQRLAVALLAQISSGAALPALTQDMRKALDTQDARGFVAALRKAVLAETPADQLAAVSGQFDHMLAPLLTRKLQAEGLPIPGPKPNDMLQAKLQSDLHQLPEAHLQDLPVADFRRDKVLQGFSNVASAMELGDTQQIERELSALMGELRIALDNVGTPESTKLAFTLSDGKAVVQELRQAILHAASPDQKPFVKLQLDHFMDPYLKAAFDELVSGVLDKVLSSDDKGPKTIEVQGRTYVRDKDSPLGSGKFGEVWTYTNHEDANDRVAMKVPLSGGETGAAARTHLVDNPLHEGRVGAQVQGSGGGAQQAATQIGVMRTGQQVNLVYRFEPGGSVFDALETINDDITPELAQAKLGLMLDITSGLIGLQAKGVYHFDTALRNVLIDKQARAKLADFGLSQFTPEGASIMATSVDKDQDKPMPIKWTAPELLQGHPATAQSEVYSLGVTLLEIAVGRTRDGGPWGGMDNKTLISLHQNGTWDPQAKVPDLVAADWPGVDTQALRALIVRMLDSDPDQRPTLLEVASSPSFSNVKAEHRQALQQLLFPPDDDADDADPQDTLTAQLSAEYSLTGATIPGGSNADNNSAPDPYPSMR